MTACIIVHTEAQASAALEAAERLGLAVTLESPAEGVHSLGALYFREMIAAARARTPQSDSVAILDCGAAPGLALAALRLGIEAVRLDADDPVLAKVRDIAGQMGRRVEAGAPAGPVLDLRDARDPRAAALAFLTTEETIK